MHLVIIVRGTGGSVHTKTLNKNMKLLGEIERKLNKSKKTARVQTHEGFRHRVEKFLRSEEGRRHKRGPTDCFTSRGGGAEHLGRDVNA